MSEEYRDPAGIVRLVWPDWEVVEKIGSGAFATVYRASRREKIAGEKDSAVKIIRIPGSDDDWEQMLAEGKTPAQTEQYFQTVVNDSLKEIRAMEALTGNTNIVSIFDYKVHHVPEDHVWYILIRMEYLQKINPAALKEDGVIRLGTDVCTALSLCRKQNIVHRDVSPDNIFIRDGNYKLGDFGVAKVLEDAAGTMHSIAGKPLYMAPEVYNATLEDADIDSAARVDIYSIGILMYRLTNHMNYPFEHPEGENVTANERNQAFRRRVINGEALPAPDQASPGLAGIILKACMADPDQRYQSAEAMRADLVSLAENARPAPQAPGNRKKFILVAVILAVLAFAAWIVLPRVLPPKAPEPARGTESAALTDSGSMPALNPIREPGILQDPDGWSEWSDWLEKPPPEELPPEEPDPNRQEEVRERHEWAALRCTYCKTTNYCELNTCRNCGRSLAHAPYVYAYSDDSVSRVVDYRSVKEFNGEDYWYSRPITEYRFRTKTAAADSAESRKEPDPPNGSAAGADVLQP